MSSIVEVRDLVKRYGDVTAVDGVSFEIQRGEVFGLLGPNGAGKTTTISAISCLISPDAGEIVVDGHRTESDSLGVRSALGVVPQEIALYPTLTAAENLTFWGRMYGLSGKALSDAVDYGLALAGLEDKAKTRIETFSGGMKRRINIAAGVLHKPRVLLMDEPTVGIDPQSRNHILGLVQGLNNEGMTVLYTSHYMEEVQQLCDRIAVVDHGKIIAMGTLNELRDVVGGLDVVDVRVSEVSDDVVERVRRIEGVTEADRTEEGMRVLTASSGSILGSLVATLESDAAHVASITVTEPDLESVFLHLTGKSLRD
jgi:ABC-2 type transport system ATP-binding protein